MTLVLSPHLDDAVLSCFYDLGSGARCATIFAGLPDVGAPATGWDRMCGFNDPREHISARQEEDAMVMDELGVEREQWGFVEYPQREHGPRPSLEELARLIASASADGEVVLAPIGSLSPSPHPDHLLVRDAAILSGRPVVLYGDMPHCLKQVGEWPDLVLRGGPPPPKAWADASAPVAVHRLGTFWSEAKAAAMRGYRTQFKPLGRLRDQASRRVLRRPEVYGVEVRWAA